MSNGRVLFVDLDGTLVATDLLHECARQVWRCRPLDFVATSLQVWRGRAYVKERLSHLASIPYAALPYRREVIELIRARRSDYDQVVLATAADRSHALEIARHTGLFAGPIIASDGIRNTRGACKLAAMREHAQRRPFDYMGDSRADLPVFAAAATGYLVNPSPALERAVRAVCADLVIIRCVAP